jgi:hypothetical protein
LLSWQFSHSALAQLLSEDLSALLLSLFLMVRDLSLLLIDLILELEVLLSCSQKLGP